MSYSAENYQEPGGEVFHVGGTLRFGDGAKVVNFPGAANVADTTGNASANAAVIKAMLLALKNAGIMEGDAWNVSVKDKSTVTWKSLPTAETASNTAHATVTLSGTKITITLDCKVSELEDADHGSSWGVHKWLCFGVNTGLNASVEGVTFTDKGGTITLTAADDSEASDVGLETGDFVLYIKAENILAYGGAFVLAGKGFEPTEYTMKIVEG